MAYSGYTIFDGTYVLKSLLHLIEKLFVLKVISLTLKLLIIRRGRHGRDRMVFGVTTTCAISASNSAHGEMYSKQHYVIKFKVCQRLATGLWFSPGIQPIKLNAKI